MNQRPIKFRLILNGEIVGYETWNQSTARWIYSSDGRAGDGEYIPHARKDQFTGLYDKNGVDIYSGDIMRRADGDVGKVEMDEGVYTMSGDYQLPLHYELYETEGAEIIGNIQTTPELLK